MYPVVDVQPLLIGLRYTGHQVIGLDADVDAEDILGHDDEDDVDSGGDEIAGDEEDAVLGHEEEEEVLSGGGTLPDVVGVGSVPGGASGGSPSKSMPDAPSPTPAEQTQAAQKQDATPSSGGPRRIVLKRRPSSPPSVGTDAADTAAATSSTSASVSTTTGASAAKEESGAVGDSASKRVRITALTPAERMEIRKHKFGVVSNEAKKEIRAQRFGITPKTPDSDVLKKRAERFGISSDTAPNSEILKKRAERFGSNVSSILTKAEMEEKMRKRQERFGIATPEKKTTTATVKVSATSKTDDLTAAEKKRMRALRFQEK